MIETFFDSEKNTDGSEILFHGLNGLIKPVYLVGRDEEREGSWENEKQRVEKQGQVGQ